MTSDEITRVNYYERQFLGVADFRDEQSYHVEMRRRHNLSNTTWGLVTGLMLTELEKEGGSGEVEVSVSPGIAIDGFGREIVLLSSVRIDPALMQNFAVDNHYEIWIAYSEERFRNPAYGYGSCDVADQRGRVRETYKICVGPRTTTHDPITVAGDTVDDAHLLEDLSVPYQQFPAAGADDLWLVRLGSARWDGTKFVAAAVGRLRESRTYIGAVARTILAPMAKLNIRERDPAYGAVKVTIEGSLTVEHNITGEGDAHIVGDLTVDGSATITGAVEMKADAHVGGTLTVDKKLGIGTTTPVTTVQIATGNDVTLTKGTGYLVIGNAESYNVAYDDNEIMARNGAAVSTLHLQADGGDLYLHKNVNDDNVHVVVKDTGRIGIGTETPDTRLHVRGGTDATLSNGSGYLVLGETSGLNMVFDDNEIIARNNGAADTLFVQASGGAFDIHAHMGDASRVHVTSSGDTGLGTTSPAGKLDVYGKIKLYGQAFSKSGSALHGAFIAVPSGTTNDWSMIVTPQIMGRRENLSEDDNALLQIFCAAAPDLGNTGFRITAQYVYKFSDSSQGQTFEDGTVSYLMVPK